MCERTNLRALLLSQNILSVFTSFPASIDIDNLIQDGGANQLEEWIQPVTFCKADSEFDQDKIDPGFIKVFRLSQLISECLLASQERCVEKLTKLEDKYNDTEKEKDKLFQEILHLKETLTNAKKELKKRKEMLATSQNEMLGQNNADEYDQVYTYYYDVKINIRGRQGQGRH